MRNPNTFSQLLLPGQQLQQQQDGHSHGQYIVGDWE
jgi:hypothetical protein